MKVALSYLYKEYTMLNKLEQTYSHFYMEIRGSQKTLGKQGDVTQNTLKQATNSDKFKTGAWNVWGRYGTPVLVPNTKETNEKVSIFRNVEQVSWNISKRCFQAE